MLRKTPLALIPLTLALAAGCHDNKQHGETFDDTDHPTPIGLVAQAQAAAGAKQDATLYDRHFRGDRLCSLGQAKLDLMVKGTVTGEPVQVYLDMSDDHAVARKAAVTAYLASAGVPAGKVELAMGPNPNLTTPTQGDLKNVYDTDGSFHDASGGGGGSGGGAAAGAGGAMGK